MDDLTVGRILKKDDPDHAVIEVSKNQDVTFTLEDGDEYLTLLFVRADGKGGYEAWNPFA